MKKNILLVDQDILVLKALKRSLHKFKDQWTVYYAQSPRAALEQLGQGTVDVLITEVRLTAADGELFLRSFLKRHPRAARIVLNSPFYGLPMPVTEPQKAVALVGLDIVKGFVLTSGLFSRYELKKRRQQGQLTGLSILTSRILPICN